MARRGSRRRSRRPRKVRIRKKVYAQRDFSRITSKRRQSVLSLKRQIPEDRRMWHPAKDLVRKYDGREATYTLRSPKVRRKRQDWTTDRVGFRDPQRVPVCKRRSERRRWLFKHGKIGKGTSVSKIRIRTDTSDLRC